MSLTDFLSSVKCSRNPPKCSCHRRLYDWFFRVLCEFWEHFRENQQFKAPKEGSWKDTQNEYVSLAQAKQKRLIITTVKHSNIFWKPSALRQKSRTQLNGLQTNIYTANALSLAMDLNFDTFFPTISFWDKVVDTISKSKRLLLLSSITLEFCVEVLKCHIWFASDLFI